MTCLGWLPWLLAALVPGPEGLLFWDRICANCSSDRGAGNALVLLGLPGSQPDWGRRSEAMLRAQSLDEGIAETSMVLLELLQNTVR